MRFSRRSGVLLSVTSLPSRFGIGDLGPNAREFVDFLHRAGQRIWQVLPVGPPAQGNSPYTCYSAFAGNPLLIDLVALVDAELLDESDLEDIPAFSSHRVDYEAANTCKMRLLRSSYQRFVKHASRSQRERFNEFCERHQWWLDGYALFDAILKSQGERAWTSWPRELAERDSVALNKLTEQLRDEIEFAKYRQHLFFWQWSDLRAYANEHDVEIVGDMPMFVAAESADVWLHRDLFHLNRDGTPAVVAGVPPDYFSETGQLWGNPIYDWDRLAETGYDWWVGRLRHAMDLFDLVRIDHFRGFEAYWEVPAGESTAVNGRWVPGPGAAFFEVVQQRLGKLPVIAEDLGCITEQVNQLRERFELPGMRVLQFAFHGDSASEYHLPHTYTPQAVVFTGTHDNDTIVGWFRGEDLTTEQQRTERERERAFALNYLGSDGSEINWDLIRLAMASVAEIAIFPLQDILGLGSEARMNRPGYADGQWAWRFCAEQLNEDIEHRLCQLTTDHQRA